MEENINLTEKYGVHEYEEFYDVILRKNTNEYIDPTLKNPAQINCDVVIAKNEGGYCETHINAYELYLALKDIYEGKNND